MVSVRLLGSGHRLAVDEGRTCHLEAGRNEDIVDGATRSRSTTINEAGTVAWWRVNQMRMQSFFVLYSSCLMYVLEEHFLALGGRTACVCLQFALPCSEKGQGASQVLLGILFAHAARNRVDLYAGGRSGKRTTKIMLWKEETWGDRSCEISSRTHAPSQSRRGGHNSPLRLLKPCPRRERRPVWRKEDSLLCCRSCGRRTMEGRE